MGVAKERRLFLSVLFQMLPHPRSVGTQPGNRREKGLHGNIVKLAERIQGEHAGHRAPRFVAGIGGARDVQEVRHRLLLHSHVEPQRSQRIEKQRLEFFWLRVCWKNCFCMVSTSEYFNMSTYLILCLMNGKITCTIPIGQSLIGYRKGEMADDEFADLAKRERFYDRENGRVPRLEPLHLRSV